MSRPIANSAGGMAFVLTSSAAWRLTHVHHVPDLVALAARNNGIALDQETLDALAILEAAAEAYRPSSPRVVPLVPVGSSATEESCTLLSTKEVAIRLGNCSTRYVTGLVKAKHLVERRQGSKIFVPEDSVLEFLAARARKASGQTA